MSDLDLPEGMEISLLFYATNSTEPDAHDGINAVITLGGKTTLAGLNAENLRTFPLSGALGDLVMPKFRLASDFASGASNARARTSPCARSAACRSATPTRNTSIMRLR